MFYSNAGKPTRRTITYIKKCVVVAETANPHWQPDMRVENIALEPVLRLCTLLMKNVSSDSNGQGGRSRSCGEQSKGHLPRAPSGY
jgi:hypothetical protein